MEPNGACGQPETGNMKGRVGLRKRRRQWLKDLEVAAFAKWPANLGGQDVRWSREFM